MNKVTELRKKVEFVMQNEGLGSVIKKGYTYIKLTGPRMREKKYSGKVYKDVLFINGVDFNALPHPPRYRVLHQIEQLHANHMDCDQCFHLSLDLSLVRTYRVFIIYRAPYSEKLGEFIKLAKSLNKVVIYDIDDLVIDTKYTDQIKFLDTMSPLDREGYDSGVRAMNRVLRLCDAAITTTERMAVELKNYVPTVFINRNTASEEMVYLSEEAYNKEFQLHNKDIIKIGYFSGSITHNDDFILIQSAIEKIMREFKSVELHIVGLLDIPVEFEDFKDRVIAHPFMDWKELPALIASMDINLAPLENTIFNEAKSENKWVEAALVRVPTVASDVGAFSKMIEHEVTGLLCRNKKDWYVMLKQLILDPVKRTTIGVNAYTFCKENCTTIYTGYYLTEFLKNIMTPNIAFVLPSLNISGGIMVALEHAGILKKKGYDVTLINGDYDKRYWFKFNDIEFPVIPSKYSHFNGSFDKAVSTVWFTNVFLETYNNIKNRYYLVQGFETDFYEPKDPFRIQANQTYSPIIPVQFLTVSKWCKGWLKAKYNKTSRFVPNGIHIRNYHPAIRDFSGKIRVLIEGDCSAFYKNVDESFKITNQLDRNKFEVWYLSNNAKPKDWYRVDKFLNKIPFEEVSEVYRQCHILLKTSILESFSYPPLEMMATGGFVVALPNDGNMEYLRDRKNCLFYKRNCIDHGVQSILEICRNKDLRDILYKNGIETAKERDWDTLEDRIVDFYK